MKQSKFLNQIHKNHGEVFEQEALNQQVTNIVANSLGGISKMTSGQIDPDSSGGHVFNHEKLQEYLNSIKSIPYIEKVHQQFVEYAKNNEPVKAFKLLFQVANDLNELEKLKLSEALFPRPGMKSFLDELEKDLLKGINNKLKLDPTIMTPDENGIGASITSSMKYYPGSSSFEDSFEEYSREVRKMSNQKRKDPHRPVFSDFIHMRMGRIPPRYFRPHVSITNGIETYNQLN